MKEEHSKFEQLVVDAWAEILKDAESVLEDWINEDADLSDKEFEELTDMMWAILRNPASFKEYL